MTREQMLDSSQSFPSSSLRGPRGPGIDYAAELENRMPIRQEKLDKMEKLGRRESKLGLRNIFGRSKTAKDGQDLNHAPVASNSTRFRTSMAELNQTPHGYQFDSNVPDNFSWKPLPATVEDVAYSEQYEQRDTAAVTKKRANPRGTGKNTKDTNSSWSLPPLFKAFPQAIHHATLPAASISADAILRINEKKSSLQIKEEEESASTAKGPEDDDLGVDKEKLKKKNKRGINGSSANFEWTTKIYILVTSGYLLQYSGDGNFDRLPEKILRLGPSSAAFATDAIPGRHWVIQVSSVADMDDTQGLESRSIFSKLSFRLTERRSASNLLMVFENAEDMEGWIAILRNEIEKQGGKKKLSETGKPKSTIADPYLREQTSQRTLIIRDPTRFTSPRSRSSHTVISPPRATSCTGTPTRQASSDRTGNQSLDDVSTTNSVVSQDERQLENLRENSNRLSFISSGQRTFVTSTGSSPEGSPTNDKFDEGSLGLYEPAGRGEIRTRPNGLEIATRRESMQAGRPFVDDGLSPKGKNRGFSTRITVIQPDRVTSPLGIKPTPNFSVPHSSNRRFSYARGLVSTSTTDGSPSRRRDRDTSPPRFGRMAPTAMQSAHRLSAVTDQAVARAIATERLPTAPKSPTLPASPIMDFGKRRLRSVSRGRASKRGDDHSSQVPNNVPESIPERTSWRLSPRKHSSASALRQDLGASRPPHIAAMATRSVPVVDEAPRGHRTSFLDIGESAADALRSRSLEPSRAAKRASMGSVFSERSARSYEVHDSTVSSNHSSDSAATVTSASKPGSGHYLNVEKTPRSSLLNRRSMPQIAVSGPPPAPPPTRALPPIPQKMQIRT
ncbi:peptidase family M20/M25/M40 protein [Pochonia chlamydosporia 170]|uniref:Peptidase family M20/M25/M40 protein n=1 Tax=Pochonia chlamydosporia 170 TaxID=1380566 RepID=A0A179FCZ1_METCM|nr:peptidase family M20/M25/M40 protein [Pochonia chlamydosporia 170]OAQ63247.1 peptidase family M20/M25/M40 protein [Pochonia chlamydosporia 170]